MATAESPLTGGSRVLAVDDDQTILLVVEQALRDAGHEVITAPDGAQALRLLESNPCDLVLTDVRMPHMDGFELVERLRAQDGTRDLPVILLTSLTQPEDVIRGLQAGADDYIRKPFDPGELVARVHVKLQRPPVASADLTAARRAGVLTAEQIVAETDRELDRSRRSGEPLAVAALTFSEYERVTERFGRHATADLLALAAQSASTQSTRLDIAGLTTMPDTTWGGLVLLMPETAADEAQERLARICSVLGTKPFTISGETVHITPTVGWTSSTDPPDAASGRDLIERAQSATSVASTLLDLQPVRWNPQWKKPARPPRLPLLERLRTPAQILSTIAIGIVVPFFIYLGLYEAGLDISWYMYLAVVAALLITASLLWVEGIEALRPPVPPEDPSRPYPQATAIIPALLPNEAATVMETVKAFLSVDYPSGLQVILAYNTPHPMPIEDRLVDLARADPRFVPFRVEQSTSKAENINAALALVEGEFTGIFDADHHPDRKGFTRAWRWLSNGYDVVQGHCLVRNGEVTPVARTVAIEFEAIYAVSHPGRAKLHGFGLFGGSNGFWKTARLRAVRMQRQALTEDIDSTMRLLFRGGRIAVDPSLVSRELAPTTVGALWRQRMRWAQGWFQVTRRHSRESLRSDQLTLRNKFGMLFLLGWREFYPWLSLQMFPLIAFLAWREGGIARLDWLIPVFVLTSLFIVSVGPVQTLFAYHLAAPEIRRHRRWFFIYLVVASLAYTEFKNVISRVAQLKELTKDRKWAVTPR